MPLFTSCAPLHVKVPATFPSQQFDPTHTVAFWVHIHDTYRKTPRIVRTFLLFNNKTYMQSSVCWSQFAQYICYRSPQQRGNSKNIIGDRYPVVVISCPCRDEVNQFSRGSSVSCLQAWCTCTFPSHSPNEVPSFWTTIPGYKLFIYISPFLLYLLAFRIAFHLHHHSHWPSLVLVFIKVIVKYSNQSINFMLNLHFTA